MASKNKFLVSVSLNNKWVQQIIDDIHQSIHGPDGYRKIDGEVLYVHSRLYPWKPSNRLCYLDLYYNSNARAKAVDQFTEELMGYKKELESEKLVNEHQKAYDTYFVVKTSFKRGRKVTYNGEAISQYISRYAGF